MRLAIRSLIIGFVLVALRAFAFDVPPIMTPVQDNAGMFSSSTVDLVNGQLKRIYENGGPQIGVLTLETLDGEAIEAASIQVTDKWKLGHKDKGDGVLFIVARKEHKMRLEIGRGLEGDIPDAYAKRIVADVITPLFKAKRFDDGLIAGLSQICQLAKVNFDAPIPHRPSVRVNSSAVYFYLFIFIFLIARIIAWLFRGPGGPFGRGGGGFWGGGGWGGGGGSWGGGNSGWSGGGGDFGGGGASGDW